MAYPENAKFKTSVASTFKFHTLCGLHEIKKR